MKVRAAVLEAFHEPLRIREFDVSPLAPGEVLVKVRAAGICGSDVHMWRGRDPRTPLPLILGHEGVGEIAETGGEKRDVFGRVLSPGDLVVWERGLMCGRCEFCVIRKQPALCQTRRTYGISIGCAEPPHLRGAYAEYMHLASATHLIKIDEDIDPAILVPATCSGSTAAHTIEQAGIVPGDTVVLIGPGPMAIFLVAFARAAGAGQIIVFGTKRSAARLHMATQMGATEALEVDDTTLDERIELVRERTHGLGARIVVDCAGTSAAVEEAIQHVAPYGRCLIPGVATPVGQVSLSVFEHVARKNVRIQGVWVSDTRHLYQAIRLVLDHGFPFEALVTHRMRLNDVNSGLDVVENRTAVKGVIEML